MTLSQNLGNILVVGPSKVSYDIKKSNPDLKFNNWEEIQEDDIAWTLIYAKRRSSPFHFIFYYVDHNNIQNLQLINDLYSNPYGEKLPLIIVLADMDLKELIPRKEIYVVDAENNIELIEGISHKYTKHYGEGIHLINKKDNDDHIIYSFPATVTENVIKELQTISSGILSTGSSNKVYLFNFKDIVEYRQLEFRELYLVMKELKNQGIRFSSILLSVGFKKELLQKGIEESFNILPGYKSAVSHHKLNVEEQKKSKFPRINVDLINPFLESTMLVFEDLTGLSFNGERPQSFSPEELTKDFAATITFGNEASSLLISLNFTRETFVQIIQEIQNNGHVDQAEDISSFLTTVLKQIYRSGRSALNEKEIEIEDPHLAVLNQKENITPLFNETINIGVNLTSAVGEIILSITPL